MPISIANTRAGGNHGPAVKVTGPSGLYFLSGISANPLYRGRPLSAAEAAVPSGIKEQSRLMLANLSEVLESSGMAWSSVGKVILYLTDIREAAAVRAVISERFGDGWTPAFTTVQVDNLVTPGARVQLDVIAAGPTA